MFPAHFHPLFLHVLLHFDRHYSTISKLQLRGRSRSQLLADLAVQRRELLAKRAKEARDKASSLSDHLPQPGGEQREQQVPGAIKDPNRWWRYDSALDPGLVVITPAMEGDTGLDEAGPLPLAEDGRFPEAGKQFVETLKTQGGQFGTAAMATAMAAGGHQNAEANGS